ncbi:hypothetical protein E4U55_006159 [Claviceps digitariae]|nr:hypothetical protein E4U55_006159 [Claviceps digitariae]
MFLKINGYQLQTTLFTRDELDRQLQNAHIAVATNQWDAESLAAFYKSIATPIPRVTLEIREYMERNFEGYQFEEVVRVLSYVSTGASYQALDSTNCEQSDEIHGEIEGEAFQDGLSHSVQVGK